MMFKDKSGSQNCTCALIIALKILMVRNGKGQLRNTKKMCFTIFSVKALFAYLKK